MDSGSLGWGRIPNFVFFEIFKSLTFRKYILLLCLEVYLLHILALKIGGKSSQNTPDQERPITPGRQRVKLRISWSLEVIAAPCFKDKTLQEIMFIEMNIY